MNVACARPLIRPSGTFSPGGEGDSPRATAERGGRRGGERRSPSPRRGEGRGEGAARCASRTLEKLAGSSSFALINSGQ